MEEEKKEALAAAKAKEAVKDDVKKAPEVKKVTDDDNKNTPSKDSKN